MANDVINKVSDKSVLEDVRLKSEEAAREICEAGGLREGSILVVGCSSSEIGGGTIGHASSPDLANAVYSGITSYTEKKGIFIAAQCCEHLNRALVIERAAAERLPYAEEVNVVPMPKAGGSFATAAYNNMKSPMLIEYIKADAGLDIGSTLIGMHLKRVAVPVRLSVKFIGNASVTAARVRPKFIGGSRAVYDEGKM